MGMMKKMAMEATEKACRLCEEEAIHDAECLRCGDTFPACEDHMEGLCDWCEHMTNKDD